MISEKIQRLAMDNPIVYQTIISYQNMLDTDEYITWEQALEAMVIMLADENDSLKRQLEKCIDNSVSLDWMRRNE